MRRIKWRYLILCILTYFDPMMPHVRQEGGLLFSGWNPMFSTLGAPRASQDSDELALLESLKGLGHVTFASEKSQKVGLRRSSASRRPQGLRAMIGAEKTLKSNLQSWFLKKSPKFDEILECFGKILAQWWILSWKAWETHKKNIIKCPFRHNWSWGFLS